MNRPFPQGMTALPPVRVEHPHVEIRRISATAPPSSAAEFPSGAYGPGFSAESKQRP